ncbi:MAG: hypothetical protein ACXADW_02880 [Candidatus Hodarchaeales archaeon]|jgi:hypothetical protein
MTATETMLEYDPREIYFVPNAKVAMGPGYCPHCFEVPIYEKTKDGKITGGFLDCNCSSENTLYDDFFYIKDDQ